MHRRITEFWLSSVGAASFSIHALTSSGTRKRTDLVSSLRDFTDDDLELLRSAAGTVQAETQEALARMRPTAPVKHRVSEKLSKRGAELTQEERRKIEIEVLKAELRAWNDIRARLEGSIIPTPVVEDAAATGGKDPTLKQAWRQASEPEHSGRGRGRRQAVYGAAWQSLRLVNQESAGPLISRCYDQAAEASASRFSEAALPPSS
jgi:hypothetical protein